MYTVKINNTDYTAESLEILQQWKEQNRLTDETEVYDNPNCRWTNAGELLNQTEHEYLYGSEQNTEPWYYQDWFIGLMVFVFIPISIVLWLKKRALRKKTSDRDSKV